MQDGLLRRSERHVAARPGPHAGTDARAAERRFSFAPGLVLSIRGDRATIAHFVAEYGPALIDTPADGTIGEPVAVEVEIEVGTRLRPRTDDALRRVGLAGGIELRDSHRTTRWVARIGPADAPTIRASIVASGVFGRSFVQGFVVEPLLSVAAARTGRMLVPGAGLVVDGDLTLVLGSSHVGKTTLAARASAAGLPVLGDDQVLLEPDGTVRPFPRRMRLYPDIAAAAPAAHRALPAALRLELALRSAAAVVVGNRVNLPVLAAVPAAPPGPIRVGRVLVVERAAAAPTRVDADDALDVTPIGPAELQRVVLALAVEQRERLRSGAGDGWALALHAVSALEASIARSGLSGVAGGRVVVPDGWDAGRWADALARAVGLTP